jgi:hypothetical protein
MHYRHHHRSPPGRDSLSMKPASTGQAGIILSAIREELSTARRQNSCEKADHDD